MSYSKFLLGLLTTLSAASVFAEVQKQDIDQVKQYLEAKRNVTTKDKYGDGTLTIGGEIGLEFRRTVENREGSRDTQKGFVVAPKLNFEYTADNTWGVIGFKFKNDLGWKEADRYNYDAEGKKPAGSGHFNKVSLDKAMFGMHLYNTDTTSVDIELGRQSADAHFQSSLQFDAKFDAAVLKLKHDLGNVGKTHFNIGYGVIDSQISHYALVAEVGIKEVMGSGFYTSYSFADYKKRGTDRHGTRRGKNAENEITELKIDPVKGATRWKYQNSQITLGYHFSPEMIGVPVKVYVSGLMNHAAKNHPETNKKEDKAWIAGVCLGKELKKEGDWNFEFNYRQVQAQAIVDNDVKDVYYNKGKIGYNNANFKGFFAKGKYAITDNLHTEVEGKWGRSAKKKIEKHVNKANEIMAGMYYRF